MWCPDVLTDRFMWQCGGGGDGVVVDRWWVFQGTLGHG